METKQNKTARVSFATVKDAELTDALKYVKDERKEIMTRIKAIAPELYGIWETKKKDASDARKTLFSKVGEVEPILIYKLDLLGELMGAFSWSRANRNKGLVGAICGQPAGTVPELVKAYVTLKDKEQDFARAIMATVRATVKA